jgi:hypothetical protein
MTQLSEDEVFAELVLKELKGELDGDETNLAVLQKDLALWRDCLIRLSQEADRQLATRKAMRSGSVQEYAAWKSEKMRYKGEVVARLRDVKEWIKNKNAEDHTSMDSNRAHQYAVLGELREIKDLLRQHFEGKK